MNEPFHGGWIEPSGKFHEAGFAEHEITASRIVRSRFPIIYERLKNQCQKERGTTLEVGEYCKDKLVKDGWLNLTGNPYAGMGISYRMFAVCFKEEKVNPKQHKVITKFINKGMQFSGFIEM